ncbi:phasin family protein [Sphingobium fluviale]|uniref:Phasin family protein n=1 Tax=Sphingobium fluviale TaxID=2506423 RepID=A0A4Q1KG20_9SPHN|nr:phasin family protein [Sphingobium fluviale]RXR27551.1 phasin family protein [Sphingobium fluviale]
MTGKSKTPRRPKMANTGTVAAKTPRTVTRKRAAVTPEAPAPKPVAMAEPAPAPEPTPELTAADLAPAEDIITETEHVIEPTVEHIEITAPPPPAVEAATEEVSQALTETEERADQKGTKIMTDVLESTKKFAEEAKGRFEAAFAEMSEKTKAGVEKSSKAMEELSALAKGNVEALVESGKIATKGVETMGQDAAEYGRVTFEKASAALKSLAAVKTPAEFFQLQSELLSSSFDAFAKEAAKNSEAMLKLAGDVAQPISTRVSIVTEKVRSIAA